MCGIIGIVGDKPAAPLILDALKRLEYRGYDSAGIATLPNGKIDRRRAQGKLVNLEKILLKQPLDGNTGNGLPLHLLQLPLPASPKGEPLPAAPPAPLVEGSLPAPTPGAVPTPAKPAPPSPAAGATAQVHEAAAPAPSDVDPANVAFAPYCTSPSTGQPRLPNWMRI